MTATGIIILAAGGSSRLGRPKQLLSFQNGLLIERLAAEALKVTPLTVVVTGGASEKISTVLADKTCSLVYNKHWEEGMASSITAGLANALSLNAEIQNIIITVCDQPFVSADLFRQLIEKKEKTGKGIVACAYADTTGTPVLFNKKYFNALQNLKGTEGAKKLLRPYNDDVATIAFPKGEVDIDTEEDYQKLLQQNDGDKKK